jgi:hypothetical protein
MPVSWQHYDAFAWDASQQLPMGVDARLALAEWAAALLGVPAADKAHTWAVASPPGRYAATVLHVLPGISHRYQAAAAAAGMAAIGVKLFKISADARREARRLLPFHRGTLPRLPGLPHPHVQRSLAAGVATDGRGGERFYVVQEWVEGETLAAWLGQAPAGLSAGQRRSIVVQLLQETVIPLWGAGTVWWDVRAANVCYDAARDRLTLIDSDALAAYAGEILGTPTVWRRRDHGRETAIPRLRVLVWRLLTAGMPPQRGGEQRFRRAWDAALAPCLRRLGHDPGAPAEAWSALQTLLADFGRGDPLGPAGRSAID